MKYIKSYFKNLYQEISYTITYYASICIKYVYDTITIIYFYAFVVFYAFFD